MICGRTAAAAPTASKSRRFRSLFSECLKPGGKDIPRAGSAPWTCCSESSLERAPSAVDGRQDWPTWPPASRKLITPALEPALDRGPHRGNSTALTALLLASLRSRERENALQALHFAVADIWQLGHLAAAIWRSGHLALQKMSKKMSPRCPRWPGTSLGHLFDIFLMTSGNPPKSGSG